MRVRENEEMIKEIRINALSKYSQIPFHAIQNSWEEVRESFEERMKRLMLHRKKDWPYQYEFWRGWVGD